VELTLKQKAFADYYIETGNATEAYKKAGYKNYKSAGVEANKTLNNPKIKGYIEERMKSINSNRVASQKEVFEYLTKVMRGDLEEEVVVTEGTGEGCSEAKIIKKQVGAKDRIKAAELMGKVYASFTDKANIEGNLGVKIVDDIE